MKMIGHEAVGEHAHRQALMGVGQQADEGVVVAVLVEDLGPTVAVVDDVVAIASLGGASGAWPAGRLAEAAVEGKGKSRMSLFLLLGSPARCVVMNRYRDRRAIFRKPNLSLGRLKPYLSSESAVSLSPSLFSEGTDHDPRSATQRK
jgi:hypothetical protein